MNLRPWLSNSRSLSTSLLPACLPACLPVGKRRYDRKQSGFGGQTKPVFHKKVRVRVCVWCFSSLLSPLPSSSSSSTSLLPSLHLDNDVLFKTVYPWLSSNSYWSDAEIFFPDVLFFSFFLPSLSRFFSSPPPCLSPLPFLHLDNDV